MRRTDLVRGAFFAALLMAASSASWAQTLNDRDAESRPVSAGIDYVRIEARNGDRQAGQRLVLVR